MNPHFEGNAGKSATIVRDIALIVPQGGASVPSTRPSSNQYQFPILDKEPSCSSCSSPSKLADHSPFTGCLVSCFLNPFG